MTPPDRPLSAGDAVSTPSGAHAPSAPSGAHSPDIVPSLAAGVADAKRALRKRMRPMRLVAEQKEGPDAALAIARAALPRLEELGLAAGRVLAGYWPISTEIDVRPLLARAEARGVSLALPAIVPGRDTLVFRRWRPTEDLEPGEFETRQPPADAPEVVPDALLVPLLAVDRAGRRLGHGRGWYDRTLAALRRGEGGGAESGRVPPAVGVCFASQVLDRIPVGAGDEPVDWILTPAGFGPVDAPAPAGHPDGSPA